MEESLSIDPDSDARVILMLLCNNIAEFSWSQYHLFGGSCAISTHILNFLVSCTPYYNPDLLDNPNGVREAHSLWRPIHTMRRDPYTVLTVLLLYCNINWEVRPNFLKVINS